MVCANADLVTRIVSGNATLEEQVEFRNHAAGCPSCAQAERKQLRVWSLMGELRPMAPARTPSASLRAGLPRIRPVAARPSSAWLVGAAAATFLAIVGLYFTINRSTQTPPELALPPLPAPAPVAIEDQPEERERVEKVLEERNWEKPVPRPTESAQAPVDPKPVVPAPEDPKPVVIQPPVNPPVEVKPTPQPAPPTQPLVAEPREEIPVAAVLERIGGDVFVLDGSARIAARSGQKLLNGMGLELAGKGSQAVVEFADGTRLVLGADTILSRISERKLGAADQPAEGKRVFLKQGVLAAQIAKQPAGEPMIFLTAQAEAKVLGTRFTLSAAATSTRLEVREGKVRFIRKEDGQFVDLMADQFALVAGKSGSLAAKPSVTAKVVLKETFNQPRWSNAWTVGGDQGSGVKPVVDAGALVMRLSKKAPEEVTGGGALPPNATDAQRKAFAEVGKVAGLGARKELPRMAWLETRPSFPFSNEVPLKIRVRLWSSHGDADRVAWLALNRGSAGQQVLSLERRGELLQLWAEGNPAPLFKKDIRCAQEWETLELWISRDQIVVRRNAETLHVCANPAKVKSGPLSLGANAKSELGQDGEIRFDDLDVVWTTKAEFEEVAR